MCDVIIIVIKNLIRMFYNHEFLGNKAIRISFYNALARAMTDVEERTSR